MIQSDKHVLKWMKADEQLTTPEQVEDAFKRPGTTLVMVNSVCGCAGGIARPAASIRYIMTSVQTIW